MQGSIVVPPSSTRSRVADLLHRGRVTPFRLSAGGPGPESVCSHPSLVASPKSSGKHGYGSDVSEVRHALLPVSIREVRSGSIGSPEHNDGSSYGVIDARTFGADSLRQARRENIRAREEAQSLQASKRRATMDKNLRLSSNGNWSIPAAKEDSISPMTMSPLKPIHRKKIIAKDVSPLVNDRKTMLSVEGNDQSGVGGTGIQQIPSSLAGGGGVRDIQAAVEWDKEKHPKPRGFQSMLDPVQSVEEHSAFRSSASPSPHVPVVIGRSSLADISSSFVSNADSPINTVTGINNAGLISIPSPLKKNRVSKRKSTKSDLAAIVRPRYHVLMVDDSAMSRKMLMKTLRNGGRIYPLLRPHLTHLKINTPSQLTIYYLQTTGHTCEEAEDGQIAVEKMKAKLAATKEEQEPMYNVVLMDFGNKYLSLTNYTF